MGDRLDRLSMTLTSALAGGFLCLGACATAMETRAPGVIVAIDAAETAALKAALADELGRAQIELQPASLIGVDRFSALPPRLASAEDRSLARPTVFDVAAIVDDGGETGACLAVRRDTGAEIPMPGAVCRLSD